MADDNFLQPEPGTAAGDHLVSGLVPLAVLALAAWLYPRLWAGARGAIALLFGTFGIVTGIEGAYALAKGNASGDDFTGLLAIPAGVVLLGLGATTLWRSTRGGSRARRYLRRFLLVVGAVASLYLVLGPLYISYVFTHVARGYVPTPELGAPYEDVSFTTSDGLELQGWYIPSKNRAAVAYLQSRSDVDDDRIGGIGLSVGGEMMLEAAAESEGLRAVVSEGAGIRSLREAAAIPDTRSRIEAILEQAVVTPSVALFSNSLPPPALDDLVGRISPRPVFIVYAVPGQGGEAELSQTFYEAAREPKAIWRVPGSEHTGGIEAQPAEYEKRVVGFFDRALLDGS